MVRSCVKQNRGNPSAYNLVTRVPCWRYWKTAIRQNAQESHPSCMLCAYKLIFFKYSSGFCYGDLVCFVQYSQPCYVLIRAAFETVDVSVCMRVLQTRGFLTIEKPCDLRQRYTSYTALQHKVLPFTHSASFQDTGKAWSNLLNFRPFKTKMKTVPLTQIDKIIFTT